MASASKYIVESEKYKGGVKYSIICFRALQNHCVVYNFTSSAGHVLVLHVPAAIMVVVTLRKCPYKCIGCMLHTYADRFS